MVVNQGKSSFFYRGKFHALHRTMTDGLELSNAFSPLHPLPVFEIRMSKFEMYQQALDSAL